GEARVVPNQRPHQSLLTSTATLTRGFHSGFHRLQSGQSKAKRGTHSRPVHGLMATCSPTGPLLNAHGMIRTAHSKTSAADLLKVAFQTEVGVTHGEQFCIY